MPSFFDEPGSDEDGSLPVSSRAMPPPRRQFAVNAEASSSRHESLGHDPLAGGGRGSRSFMSRLSTSLAGSTSPENRYGAKIPSVAAVDELEIEEYEHDNDVKKLGRIWTRERGTVNIMQWEEDVIDVVLDKLEQQQQLCTLLRGDPTTSEEEHFKLMLVETEMERVKFLVRGYLRTRLSKIEKFSHYISITPELHSLLSPSELQHAQKFTELLHQHFSHSVLESLPEWLRKMDDTLGDGVSMVSRPDLDLPVLVLCLRDCGDLVLEGGERASMARGTTHIVKYQLVERWIQLGYLEVL